MSGPPKDVTLALQGRLLCYEGRVQNHLGLHCHGSRGFCGLLLPWEGCLQSGSSHLRPRSFLRDAKPALVEMALGQDLS